MGPPVGFGTRAVFVYGFEKSARDNIADDELEEFSLNVTTGLVSQWERGEKHPRGASLKLPALVARNGLTTVA